MALSIQKIRSELQETGLVLGGMIIVLFTFLIASGIVLSLFYNPNPEDTYQSMVWITENPFIGFVRNFHYWSSDILLFILFLHMTRVALTKPSGRARRYAWWLGVGLLIFVSAEMLLGTFLRGDEEALEAFSHFFIGNTLIVANYLPGVYYITAFFSGHEALFRFFILHAIFMPFWITLLIVAHGLFAPTFRSMMAPWKKVTDATIRGELLPEKGFTSAGSVRKLFWATVFIFTLVTLLSLFVPAPLMSQPFGGLEVTKPPWWLLWVVFSENIWGLAPIVFMPPLLFLIFLLIPFFSKDKPGADWGVYIYLITIALVTLMGFWANFASQVAHTEDFVTQSPTSVPMPPVHTTHPDAH